MDHRGGGTEERVQEIAADVFFTPRESLEVQAGLYGVPKRERSEVTLLMAHQK